MKTIIFRRDEIDGPSLRKLPVIAVIIGACFLMPRLSWAQQAESTAFCDEAGIPPIPEPVPLAYGDHTEGCLIDPATESDSFRFDGAAGDVIRIIVLGLSNFFDPSVEVRDNTNSLIASEGCGLNTSLPCSFTIDAELSTDGTHTVSVSDQGANSVGNFTLQLERILPAPDIERLSYDSLAVVDGQVTEFIDESSVVDTISPQTDVDHYYFNGVAGTSIRFNVLGQSNFFDPAIEVRDPTGALALNGLADGAGCGTNTSLPCSFSVDLLPLLTGTYTVLLSDIGSDSGGNFQLSLWCISADCDNDGDGIEDIRPEVLRYGESVTTNSVSPQVDGDFFTFMGTPSDIIRFSVLGQSNFFDPTIEVRDPTGALVLNGSADGAGCGTNTSLPCSFTTPDVGPTLMGPYTLILYDDGTDSAGNYDLTLECVFSPDDFVCENLPGSFPGDVPEDYWAFNFIETLADSGITVGCGDGDSYCPLDPVTRAQMAVFIERGLNGGNFRPPPCVGDQFNDVPCGSFAAEFIEQFSRDGITAGCGNNNYCPHNSVTRAQMAVFLLRAEHGAGFSPPPATGRFTDVPLGSFAVDWIEQLAAEGITSGCGADIYCPDDPVTRDQMAVFLVRTFGL